MIRQGEILLTKIKSLPKGETKTVKKLIVGHSETGHHHILEAERITSVELDNAEKLFFEITKPGKLVHKKTIERHKTLPIAPGIYKVTRKQEYDPFQKVIREVWD